MCLRAPIYRTVDIINKYMYICFKVVVGFRLGKAVIIALHLLTLHFSYKEGLFCWSENGETQSQSCIELCEGLRLTIQLAFTTYTSTLV